MIRQREAVQEQKTILKRPPEYHCPSRHGKSPITWERERASKGKVWSRQEASESSGHWAALLLTSPANSNPADRKCMLIYFHFIMRSKSWNSTDVLATRVSSKLEEGDYKGAVKLACSSATIAEQSSSTEEAMKLKHPPRYHTPINGNQPHPTLLGFTIDLDLIRRAIMSFPSSSSGRTDGLLTQHLKDLIRPAAEDGAESVLNALTALITPILECRTPTAVCSLLFSAKLTALTKENGGICPVASTL